MAHFLRVVGIEFRYGGGLRLFCSRILCVSFELGLSFGWMRRGKGLVREELDDDGKAEETSEEGEEVEEERTLNVKCKSGSMSGKVKYGGGAWASHRF